MKTCQMTIPAVTYAGQGSQEKLAEILVREKAESVLLFTDKGVRSAGLTKRVEEICSGTEWSPERGTLSCSGR